MKISHTLLGAGLAAAGIIALALLALALPNPFDDAPIRYGVTFSRPHAEGIGLNWKEVYTAALDDLGVRRLRLSAYWDQIEPREDEYDFTALDYQMDEAARRGAKVVLGVGRKLPRWPECHIPGWAGQQSEAEQREALLEMLADVAARYRDHPALAMWQLENEPFFAFGECPAADPGLLRAEERVVRMHGCGHPILITDSGELSLWLQASRFGDVLGTTMYRTVFSENTRDLFSYDYLFPAWGYRAKARYINLLRGKDVIISELQGEPWGRKPWPELSRSARRASFSPQRFAELDDFARRTGLDTAYWWGVEYWYWEKEVKGDDAYWQYASSIFE